MNVFITGGTGFIGSNLLNRISSKNYNLICSKRFGSAPRLKLKKEPKWVSIDFDKDFVDIFKGCEVFVHCAAYGVSPKKSDWLDSINYNIVEPMKLIYNAVNLGIKNFILFGSILELEKSEYIKSINSDMSSYIASKKAFLEIFLPYAKLKDLNITYFRLPNVYGEGQYEGNLWPSLKKAAAQGKDFTIKDKEVVKSFLHIDKVSKAIEEEVENFNNRSETKKNIKVVDLKGDEMTVYEFAKTQWSSLGAIGRLR